MFPMNAGFNYGYGIHPGFGGWDRMRHEAGRDAFRGQNQPVCIDNNNNFGFQGGPSIPYSSGPFNSGPSNFGLFNPAMLSAMMSDFFQMLQSGMGSLLGNSGSTSLNGGLLSPLSTAGITVTPNPFNATSQQDQQDYQTLKTDLQNDGLNLQTILQGVTANGTTPLTMSGFVQGVESAASGLTTTQQAAIATDLTNFQNDAPVSFLGGGLVTQAGATSQEQDYQTLKTDLQNDGLNLQTILQGVTANGTIPLTMSGFVQGVESAASGLTTTQQTAIATDLTNFQNDDLIPILNGGPVNPYYVSTTATTTSTATPVTAFGLGGLSAPTAQAASDLQTLDSTLQADGVNMQTLITNAFNTAMSSLTATQQSAITAQLQTLANEGIQLP